MPALPLLWMDPSKWHTGSLHWAANTYLLLAPKINVKGRMALLMLVAVVWAFTWLLWRAYSVLTTPNDILVEKLGLDIPPTPLITLEEISEHELQITWKYSEPSTSVQEHHVEVNGRLIGTTKKHDMGAAIYDLVPGSRYDIRVFCVSSTDFQTPSQPLHVRLPGSTPAASQDEAFESMPKVRAIAIRNAASLAPAPAPTIAREFSGGQPTTRRGTTGRRPSPANHGVDSQQAQDIASRAMDEEEDGDLAELSQKFQKAQQDIDAVEQQIQDEDRDFQASLKELEARRDELKQLLKDRDEASSDLRKQVHKAETASRTALNEKTKKERLLQQRENQRRKRRDDIAKWEEQTAWMKEEIAGIETQKAAIEQRAKSDLREIRRKIEEEQKEVQMLEEDNKEKAMQIKAMEEERQQVNVEDETDETREADRLDHERDMRWRARYEALRQTHTNLWHELKNIQQQVNLSQEQINVARANRVTAISFAPIPPFDPEMYRPNIRQIRRPRHTSSHGSSISSPRGPFNGPEPMPSVLQYNSVANMSPTSLLPSFFNPQNGMTFIPSGINTSTADDVEPIANVPMSPRADLLLPADLLGDESADELPDAELTADPKRSSEPGTMPFPKIGSPALQEARRTQTPSSGSSSGRSFSSPMQTSAPAVETEKSSDSGHKSDEKPLENIEEDAPQQSAKPRYMSMSSMFGLNRQRGKTLADQPPLLGSLKSGQSQSFPREVDEFDPSSQPRRRLSYGGNWAFPGTLLKGHGADEKDPESSRLASARRFGIPGFGKSATPSGTYDPFGIRSSSFDPGLRGDTSSPRPSSTYSFDKMPRPSLEAQFNAWNLDKAPIRNSPLAPDWKSFQSFSRNHSRRPSVVHGSTSNLSLPQNEQVVIEPDRKPMRPLQAPIGTRPKSSQQASTPKLNPAAPSFTTIFGRRGDKTKEKAKTKESKEKLTDQEAASPPESRKSRGDTGSLAATISTLDSDTLDRTVSATSANLSVESTAFSKPTFISKITRKASSNKFGSWKEKGGGLFSRKETSLPNGENEEEQGSSEYLHLGRSLESTSTTPSAEEKKTSRSSLSNWNFMRKSKKGKEDLTASEISESSERASDLGDEMEEEEV
ncbi:uncharacterized protein PV06_10302 [Exophiala oligosperma]|uniref:Fibronectin type-III domain-containing protein n=2 Tax=Chaetothyriales TaxID=34395 RepID=A0A0D2BJS9_9EURO|nr:uncharacterized protein PV06_10302 [Exophiala oligosperma]KIW37662.1 hypothetical protein PV06_10302 [Exophiala oligosperma]